MTAVTRLQPSFREKIWGATDLEPWFPNSPNKIGEVWFNPPNSSPILVKFLYTTERLSVQVHPTGPAGVGKTEMWYVLRAAPDSTIAAGFQEDVTEEDVRKAARDGSLESLLEWHPAIAGDIFFTPSGTVHAIGAGLALVEIQQNSDITYRLYDYGRPRETHLEEALEVADFCGHPGPGIPIEIQENREILAACPHFVTEKWIVDDEVTLSADPDRFIICVAGQGHCGREGLSPGTVLYVRGDVKIEATEPLQLLLTYRPLPE